MAPRSSAKPSRTFLTPAHSLSGRYELLGRLGSGGMAEVYLARAVGLQDLELEKIVVLKRVLPERADDPRYAAMFRDEARVAATLEHPNIVHTHDIGVDDDECFFTMEYLHGEDLKALLAKANQAREQLPLELVLQIAVGCVAGLHYAHEQTDYSGRPLEIVHRDISPSNIIVTRQSGVKLIDFGIAKATSDKEQTAVGVLKGKVAYMSPEQCRGEVLDRRSDIFAMGIVLYEMVTMERPYKGSNVLATVHKLLGEEPPPPRQLRPECPPALERIVLRALEKDPHRRYQSAFELQEELELVTRDHQLHGLPGALGRYLEHLFGPKPHPWRQHAKRPPAMPRWAWEQLDSTVTTPRSEPETHGVPVALGSEVRPTTMPVTQAGMPSASPATSPTTGAHPPTGGTGPTGSYVPVPLEDTFAAELPADLGSRGATPVLNTRSPSTRPGSTQPPTTWALKHLLVGGLLGGVVALAGLSLWVRMQEPTPSSSPAPSQPVVTAVEPATRLVVGAPEPEPASEVELEPEPTTELEPDVGEPEPEPEPATELELEPDVDERVTMALEPDETRPATNASADANDRATAQAVRLLERARGNLFAQPTQAYRDAKASYELRRTQTALQLMGHAACRMRDASKALHAHRRLRSKAQRELASSCLQLGIALD